MKGKTIMGALFVLILVGGIIGYVGSYVVEDLNNKEIISNESYLIRGSGNSMIGWSAFLVCGVIVAIALVAIWILIS